MRRNLTREERERRRLNRWSAACVVVWILAFAAVLVRWWMGV